MEQKYVMAAIDAALKAGGKILSIYNDPASDFEIERKADNSPLTIADRKAHEAIVAILNDTPFPVLSEEGKHFGYEIRRGWDTLWIVDPLDGTKEFIKRNGQFTVNIALSYQHKSVMGVIYVPVTGELYYAAQGQGAYLDTKDETGKKLQVSGCTDIHELRMVMSSSHGCEQMDKLLEKYKISNFVKMGSSLKGCVVAKGEAEVYYRFNPTMEWDTAAMQCIVEEAGAIFRQMDDTPMLYNREDSLNAKGFYIINSQDNKLVLD